MTPDEVTRMAREAGFDHIAEADYWHPFFGRFAALVAAAERNKLAAWMMEKGYATGHGDTIEDLLVELDWQIAENWTRAMVNGVAAERTRIAALIRSGRFGIGNMMSQHDDESVAAIIEEGES